MSTLILVMLALIPAVVLCVYVFKKDRVEKEPIGLLVKLLILGALSCIPVAFVETKLAEIINYIFAGQITVMDNYIIYLSKFSYYLYELVNNFIGIALIEEGAKFLILIWITRKNKEFNSFFDGIIYAVFVSLGFAAFENVLYVLSYGFETAVLRAVLSVPGHMFFAVFMGYHYSLWHIVDKVNDEERLLKLRGLIPMNAVELSSFKNKAMCLLVPVLAHGWYDFCCTINETWATVMLYAFVVFMYVHCFGKIKTASKADATHRGYVRAIIRRRHPSVDYELV